MQASSLMRRILAGACLLGIACAAVADDLNPPPYRGGVFSVEAEWDWLIPPDNWFFMPPDTFNTGDDSGVGLFKGFATHAEVQDPSNWTWVKADGDGGIQVVAADEPPLGPPGTASIAFKIQNFMDINPIKYLRMQVTYTGVPPTSGTFAEGIIPSDDDDMIFDAELVTHVDMGLGYFYEDWIIEPNPFWELFTLDVPVGTTLDQVYFDTISIPAPGTVVLALLGVGLLFARRR